MGFGDVGVGEKGLGVRSLGFRIGSLGLRFWEFRGSEASGLRALGLYYGP